MDVYIKMSQLYVSHWIKCIELHPIPDLMFRGKDQAAVLPSLLWGGAACTEGG